MDTDPEHAALRSARHACSRYRVTPTSRQLCRDLVVPRRDGRSRAQNRDRRTSVHQRRQRIRLLEERALALEADLETKSRLAAVDERSRIAREMHDVIAHGMSAVVVQAGAGRRVVETDTEAATEVFATIERIGRESIDEMRRMLGLLRDGDGGPEMAPQPGIDDYGEIEVREIFGFRRLGTERDGSVRGEFYATGYLPSFLDEYITHGLIGEGEPYL